MNSILPSLILALAASLSPQAADAALIVTYAEDSSSYVTSLANTSVLTFNSIPPNTTVTNYVWTHGAATVGTIDRVHVLGTNVYGGAGSSGSNYAVQSQTLGGANATPTTTIRFDVDHAYFGFWWSAGDDKNVLTFYSDDAMVARFTTESLLNKLASSPDYYGNPRLTTQNNPGQAYAFINFFGIAGTTWDEIVFSNQGTSGFESDNWTDRAAAWGSQPEEHGDPPGVKVATVTGSTITVIPEPSSSLCLVLSVSLLLARRRRGNPPA